MNFSTRTTYGLRAMINLAKNSRNNSISLTSIAQDEHISKKYLERLFAKLKKAGLVKAVKGAKGGYKLAKNPKQICTLDIIKALEGKMSPFHCIDEHGKIYCDVKCRCGATKVLLEVQKAVNTVLNKLKLSDLL